MVFGEHHRKDFDCLLYFAHDFGRLPRGICGLSGASSRFVGMMVLEREYVPQGQAYGDLQVVSSNQPMLLQHRDAASGRVLWSDRPKRHSIEQAGYKASAEIPCS